MKSLSVQSRRIVGWSIALVLFVLLLFGWPLYALLSFGRDLASDAQVHDAVSASPDGAYIATTRDIDTGAVGSDSCVLIKPASGQFPKFGGGDGEVAYGPYGGFGPIKWIGSRTLLIPYGSDKVPPGGETRWRDVKIVYK